MKIGIISDTHDDIHNTKKAIKVFNKLNVDYVFHAGDYIYPGIIELFKELQPFTKFYGVRGNNDGELMGLINQFSKLENGVFFNEFGRVSIDNREVGIYHGTNEQLTETLIDCQLFDLLILGHTHKKRIEKIGRTLVMNPGALNSNFFSNVVDDYPSVIVYDPDQNTETQNYAKFLPLDKN